MGKFIFNNISSEDMGLVIERYPMKCNPRKKMTTYSIPGRNEPLHQWDGSWEPVPVRYRCWFESDPTGDQARRIKQWLHSAPCGAKLRDSYDWRYYRKATYVGGDDIENIRDRFGRFDVCFQASAEQFENASGMFVQSGNDVFNHTPWPAKPLISITGSVSGSLKIGNSLLLVRFEGYDDVHTLTVDCDIQEAWERNGNEIISRNNCITLDEYPVLMPGSNLVEITGGITAVSITTRFYTV